MRSFALAVTASALALCACGGTTSGKGDASRTPTHPSSTRVTHPTSHTAPPPPTHTTVPPLPSTAQSTFAAMTESERIGQLFMVDCPTTSVAGSTVTAIRSYHVGSVILDGTSHAGLSATATVTSRLQGLAPHGVGLFIATDQEGGLVQRLQGTGFSDIPSAVDQGTVDPARLRAEAAGWGAQLRAAGVNVNLAPVLDTVPAGFGSNPPIGDLDREYGHDPATVTSHGVAVAQGMLDARVDPTAKHFPGLGRVTGNTDTTSHVTDYATSRHDPYLAPFAAAVQRGVPFVMMSTAIYSKIDPNNPAAFSPTIVTGMLRGDLGFRGVIISDDLGNAAQVSGYSIGQRAVSFLAAGGTMVLTVDATQAATMTAAVAAKVSSDPAFKAAVDADALLVLKAKQARGLLS